MQHVVLKTTLNDGEGENNSRLATRGRCSPNQEREKLPKVGTMSKLGLSGALTAHDRPMFWEWRIE